MTQETVIELNNDENKIITLMKVMGLNQVGLAKKIGVTQMSISFYSRGHMPNTKTFIKLQKLCKQHKINLTIDDFNSDKNK